MAEERPDHRLAFRPIEERDIPRLAAWRNAPHVLKWWHDRLTLQDARKKYLPRIRGEEPTRCFIMRVNGEEIGMIQTYRVGDHPDYAGQLPLTPDTWGIDLFIGEKTYLYRGLGSRLLRAFMDQVLFPEGVQTVSIDPSVENRAAIRAYEKAGFQHVLTRHMRDEPEPTYLMVLRREDVASG